jgi:hypothetical protein
MTASSEAVGVAGTEGEGAIDPATGNPYVGDGAGSVKAGWQPVRLSVTTAVNARADRRVVDQQHPVLRAQTGAAVFVRATRVDETADSVVVVVKAIGLPLPSTGSILTDVPVALKEPLGRRAVVDDSSGRDITLLQDLTPE